MLKQLLEQNDAIQLQVETQDWRDALKIAATPLLNHDFISEDYLRAITKTTEETGAYYVFEDEMFALPHARPEDGVNKMGFSLMTLKEPISINDSPEVDLIIMLSALDGRSHIEHGLKPIFEMLSDSDTRNKIKQAQTKEEVLCLL
ncbi:PTS sugar transporter subunit IIA [Vibrio sp. SCSIO 43140]|uniref:PTS sugar transporter subunit IIA n=1 Tax=Vibrio sp. SCSIO 43140 TaxID=2819100 RepID=UPI00207501D2|nr:PTS sugar transporter subunit IIA [Vibrio sp. SCSIO 43140]USD61372.1 PTS sugar transporter subunit IIA [Vibrio sp. SCSIO 43140]